MGKTQPARGMRDFLPADVRRREYVIGVVRGVYERYGFEPLETPAVENIETLTGKYGEEGNQLIFKILKRGEHERTGEADLALRYDLTVPLARVVAEYGERLPKFFKRYQIQPVWRADRPARGRFREFYQCDVDAIGSRSMTVEAELCAAASDALTQLGFTNFTIRLNHRQVLAGVLEQAGVAADKQADALVALDKLDKIGAEGVARELIERGVAGEAGVKLLRFFEGVAGIEKAAGTVDVGAPGREREAFNAAMLGRLVEFLGDNEAGARGADELRQILQFAEASGTGVRIKLDPSLARGLSYYTGAIMEINVPDLAGSLGGGGRYDKLIGMFSGRDIPACGLSLGLERIILVMTERDMFPSSQSFVTSPADVMVAVMGEGLISESLSLAEELRSEGLRVEVYPEPDKIRKQFKHASQRNIPFVAVNGEDERQRNEVTLKDMRSGQQQSVKRKRAGLVIRYALRLDMSQNLRLDKQSDWSAIAEKFTLEFGSFKQRSRFPSLFREYLAELPNLLRALNHAFVDAVTPKSLLDDVILSLNKLCVNDFEAILLLSINGHGDGAIQLVPNMYERIVVARYLHLYPEHSDELMEYWEADFTNLQTSFRETTSPSQSTIKKNKSNWRSQNIWRSVSAMAKEVGLGSIFFEAYRYPKRYVHPSVISIGTELRSNEEEPIDKEQKRQSAMINYTLPTAFMLIMQVVKLQIEHFELDENDPAFTQLSQIIVKLMARTKEQILDLS